MKNFFIKKIDPMDAVVWGSTGICFVLFILLGLGGGFYEGNGIFATMWTFLAYSAHTFGTSLVECLEQLALFLFLFLVTFAFIGIVARCVLMFFPKSKWHKMIDGRRPFTVFWNTMKRMWKVVLMLLPVAIFLILVSLVFGEANILDKMRLQDLAVIGWEREFTGVYVFAALGAVRLPHLLIDFIVGCFTAIAVIVIMPALFVGYATPRVLKEMITAFCIGMMILIPLWLLMPALSPQDRFIDNVYGLSVPPQIAAAVANYHPQPEIEDFLRGVRSEKAGLPDLPTTTIPSAHVFWAAIAGWYFFRSKKWLGWAMLPFLIASGVGTVILAQHYLLDVFASLIVAWVAITITDQLVAIKQ